MLTRTEHFYTVVDCEVQMSKAINTDHYPLVGTIKSNMKLATTKYKMAAAQNKLETGRTRNARIH